MPHKDVAEPSWLMILSAEQRLTNDPIHGNTER